MKAIILAGGLGTRLDPITLAVSKQMLPIFDKPMIYYPLTTLMLAGIRDFVVISSSKFINSFKNLLGNGNQWGISIEYVIQKKPDGIASAFLLVSDFIKNEPVTLILGDNIFYGHNLAEPITTAISNSNNHSTIFSYRVRDPSNFGVVEFDQFNKPIKLIEKPSQTKSKYGITGLYVYSKDVFDRVKQLSPSKRGELEITDLNKSYLKDNKLKVEILKRGVAWFDTGSFDSILNASLFVSTLEKRQGFKIACPEEVAWRNGWLTDDELLKLSSKLNNYSLKSYLVELLD